MALVALGLTGAPVHEPVHGRPQATCMVVTQRSGRETVANALDAAAPCGPAAPYWIGLDHDTYTTQLADLRRWVDIVLRQQYSGYELRDCWPRHTDAIWELSTLAAEWHHTYRRPRPDLARALEFHDRWLPGTMRRITSFTRECRSQCVTLRSPARPSYH
jgi:hypothetical protein